MHTRRERRNVAIGGLSNFDDQLLELHAAREIGPFWKAARRLLESALPLHFVSLYPQTASVMPSAIFRKGAPFRTQSEFERFQKLNPMSLFFDEHPHVVVWRLSDIIPEAELLRSAFYRHHLALEGDMFLAGLCFRQQQTVQALIGLHRRRQDRDFSEIEMQLLELLHPHLDTALERVLSNHREQAERSLLRVLVSQLPLATLLLDWDLSILLCNESAKEMAAIWNLGPNRARSIKSRESFDVPCEVYEECQTMKTQWVPRRLLVQPTSNSSTAIVRCGNLPELRVRLRLVDPEPNSLSMPSFLVIFEDWRPVVDFDTRVASTPLSLVSRLSHREQEVARLICAGHSNKEVAEALGKSTLTVKKQLQSIYQKLHVTSRTRLIRLLGSRSTTQGWTSL